MNMGAMIPVYVLSHTMVSTDTRQLYELAAQLHKSESIARDLTFSETGFIGP